MAHLTWKGPWGMDLGERVTRLETQMVEVQEGVSNFRDFQKRGNTFFDRAEAVWEADDKRRKRNFAVALTLIPILAAVLGWITVKGTNVILEILQIERDWKTAHPSEFVKPQSLFNPPDNQPYQAQTQDAISAFPKE